jgi:hypothetical protein
MPRAREPDPALPAPDMETATRRDKLATTPGCCSAGHAIEAGECASSVTIHYAGGQPLKTLSQYSDPDCVSGAGKDSIGGARGAGKSRAPLTFLNPVGRWSETAAGKVLRLTHWVRSTGRGSTFGCAAG